MRILLANTYFNKGGASVACKRLSVGLSSFGHEVMLVHSQNHISNSSDRYKIHGKNDLTINKIIKKCVSLFFLKKEFKPSRHFSSNYLISNFHTYYRKYCPDVLNLHWIGDDFISLKSLSRISKPIVWTLHDEWAYTGGCHYTLSCEKYLKSCGYCPVIQSKSKYDISWFNLLTKKQFLKNLNIKFVTPSEWLAKRIKKSSVFNNVNVEVIRNPIDTGIFKPLDKKLCRNKLNLPEDSKIILFGGVSPFKDPRKGGDIILHILNSLYHKSGKIKICFFGDNIQSNHEDLISLGYIDDETKLACIYNASDIFVCPSVIENSPNVIVEALSCGIPVISSNVGGIPELVQDGISGYIVKNNDSNEFCRVIFSMLSNPNPDLGVCGRKYVETHCSSDIVSAKYSNFFQNAFMS